MKVAVAVHGRFHGFELAGQLRRHGLLSRLITTYPAFAARRFLPAGTPLATLPWLEMVRRAHAKLGLPGRPDLFIASHFGRALAADLPAADVLVGWSGATLEAIKPAQARGMKVVLERGSTHIGHQTEVLAEAHARFGLSWRATDPRLIARESAEYAAADVICTSCSYARQTFIKRGVAPDKVVFNPYGVDLARFCPAERPAGNKRVLFVGSVGVRKGIPWLLDAFRTLPADWSLHLVGPIEPGFDAVLAKYDLDRVVVRGPLPGAALAAEYAAADIFCLPSLEEGFALVILQAMASGIAVVASTVSGAPDAGEDGVELSVVPPADKAALADALGRLAADPEARAALGWAARACIARGFSWAEYGERAIALYRGLCGS
jgi:glycosyltransferase involved in cell wall biosynthesis